MSSNPLTIKVKIDRIRQYEADGRRPPGYADAMLAKATGRSTNGKWAVFDAETYRALAAEHQAQEALDHLAAKEQKADRRFQPGDVLALAIKLATGVEPDNRCQCKRRMARMNRNGWRWCLRNRRLIAEWLAEAAAPRGHTIDPDRAGEFVKAALREVWARLTSPKPAA